MAFNDRITGILGKQKDTTAKPAALTRTET